MGSSTEKPDGARGQNYGLTFPLTLKFGGEGKVLKSGELASIHPGGPECHPGPNLVTYPQKCSPIQIVPNVLFTFCPSCSHACVRYTHSDSCSLSWQK